jgi:hypothetical protein
LQRIQCLHDEAVGLRPAINDVNRRVTARHVAEQSEQRGFAVVVIAEFVGLHLFGMAVGKGMVPVIEVGAVPVDAVIIEPGGAEFGLETFAEAAFGLGIDVDAFGDVGVHVNSWSVLMFLRFGRLKGVVSATALGVIAAGWPLRWAGGWESELFPAFSQCGLAARFNLRR